MEPAGLPARWPLLLGICAGMLALALLGPTLQGSAAALLCVAGAAALGLSSRGAPPEPVLRIVGRLRVAPRTELAIVETDGRRYLVSTGASLLLLPPREEG